MSMSKSTILVVISGTKENGTLKCALIASTFILGALIQKQRLVPPMKLRLEHFLVAA